MGKKIVIDTNVYLSALGWGGKPLQAINQIIDDGSTIVISEKQMQEILKVMDYPKFGFSISRKESLLLLLRKMGKIIKTENKLDVSRDKSDNLILEPCEQMKIDYILTGDNDLLVLKEFNGTKIVTPKEFLKLVKN